MTAGNHRPFIVSPPAPVDGVIFYAEDLLIDDLVLGGSKRECSRPHPRERHPRERHPGVAARRRHAGAADAPPLEQ